MNTQIEVEVGEKFSRVKAIKYWDLNEIIVSENRQYKVIKVEEVEIELQSMYHFIFERLPDIVDIDDMNFAKVSKSKQNIVKFLFRILRALFYENELALSKYKYVFDVFDKTQHGTFYLIKSFACWDINSHIWDNRNYYKIVGVRKIEGMYIYKLKLDNLISCNVRILLQNFVANLIFTYTK